MDNKRDEILKGISCCLQETEEDKVLSCEDCPYLRKGCDNPVEVYVTLPISLVEDVRAHLKEDDQEWGKKSHLRLL